MKFRDWDTFSNWRACPGRSKARPRASALRRRCSLSSESRRSNCWEKRTWIFLRAGQDRSRADHGVRAGSLSLISASVLRRRTRRILAQYLLLGAGRQPRTLEHFVQQRGGDFAAELEGTGQREMLGSQKGGADFSSARPLRVPRDRMHQGRAGGGTEHGVDDEGFGETRVFERGLHDSGFAGYGFGIDDFAVDDFAIHGCYIQQERSGY